MTGSVNECYTGLMSGNELRFHKLLSILAARCKTELDEIEIELYDRHLSYHGYDKVCTALEAILIERSGNDPFPPIGIILGRMGHQVTVKTLAMDVTNRIATAVSKKGYNWADKVPDFEADMQRVLGEVGVLVVKRLGGWHSIIEFANGNPNHYRTWLRDSALSVIETHGPILLTLPPPEAPAQLEQKKDVK